jgi:pectate lyase
MIYKVSTFLVMIMMPISISFAQETILPLAFPTAEGYGKYTVGGRAGRVYEVTTLEDSGPGSLREAISASEPRTVVFRVSGTIQLKSQLTIRNSYITIAGQTAPGDGICLRGYPLNINADQVIIRYIRVRLGDETGTESDAISARGHKNIILDHVSASWSIDETMSIYHCDSITVQWCIISESLFKSRHSKGAHGFGGIWGSNFSSYHHNLIACHSSRNPRFAGGSGYVDFRNNVIYNWGYNSVYGGGALHKEGRDPRFLIRHTDVNMVSNYFKPGPATTPGDVRHRIANPSWANGDCGKWFVLGNVMEGNKQVTADNWNGGIQPNSDLPQVMDSIRRKAPWDAMPIKQHTAEEAYDKVLDHAGASFPKRDAVDLRVINDVRHGSATYEGTGYKSQHKMVNAEVKSGIIDTQEDVGGWPVLKTTRPPMDSDHDGMPDEWEKNHNLSPLDPSDGSLLSADGCYTNLEIYLSSLTENQ